MSDNRGFTLIEALMTAAIMACGLVAVASVFSFAIRANISNRQMAEATSLLYDKMEELRSTPQPSTGSDFITLQDTYIRTWQVDTVLPRQVTVTIYAASNPLTHSQMELIAATTLTSPSF